MNTMPTVVRSSRHNTTYGKRNKLLSFHRKTTNKCTLRPAQHFTQSYNNKKMAMVIPHKGGSTSTVSSPIYCRKLSITAMIMGIFHYLCLKARSGCLLYRNSHASLTHCSTTCPILSSHHPSHHIKMWRKVVFRSYTLIGPQRNIIFTAHPNPQNQYGARYRTS